MGVTKTMISPGNGVDKPQKGDKITMEYTGNLYDPNAPGGKGDKFDSSVGRGDFVTDIGVGRLIKGTFQLTALALVVRAIVANILQVGTRASSRPTVACLSARRPLSSSPATTPTATVASLASSRPTLPSSCMFDSAIKCKAVC